MAPPVVTQTQAPVPYWTELINKVDAKIQSLLNKRGWYNQQVNHAKINFLKEIKDLLENPPTDILGSLDAFAAASPYAFYRILPGISETEKLFKEVYATYQVLAKKRNELIEKTRPFTLNINPDDITVEGKLSARDHIDKINTYYQDKDNMGKKISRKEGLYYSVMRVIGDDGNTHTLTFYRNLRPNSNLYSLKNKQKKGGVLVMGRSPLRIVLVESEINGVKKTWWGACKVIKETSFDDIEREAKAMRDIGLPHTQDAFAFYRKRKSSREPFKRGIVVPLLNGIDFSDFCLINFPRLSISTFLSFYSDIIKHIIITHEKGYLHGDIKNENLMCTMDLHGHLCDFGLSIKSSDINNGFQFYGTPLLMADEALQNYGTEFIQYSSDLFSLGASIKMAMKWHNGYYKRDFIIRSGLTFPAPKFIDGKLVNESEQLKKDLPKTFDRMDFFRDFRQTLNYRSPTLFGPRPELEPLFDYTNKLMDYKTNSVIIHTAKDAKRLLLEFHQVMTTINTALTAPAPSASAVSTKP